MFLNLEVFNSFRGITVSRTPDALCTTRVSFLEDGEESSPGLSASITASQTLDACWGPRDGAQQRCTTTPPCTLSSLLGFLSHLAPHLPAICLFPFGLSTLITKVTQITRHSLLPLNRFVFLQLNRNWMTFEIVFMITNPIQK